MLPADLVELLTTSRQGLVADLAPELAAVSERRGKGTVAARFREQLQDLVQRLEEQVARHSSCSAAC